MTKRRLWTGIAGYWLAGAAVVAGVGAGPASAWPVAAAAATGIGGGLALFALLARRLPSVGGAARPLAFVLVVSATAEELVWRRFVLAGLAGHTSLLAALLASTCMFAFAHGRLRFSRIATGVVFGLLLVATGGVVAPACAHAAYNLAVAAAAMPVRPVAGAAA
jgi:membrane protease YdiL (CAAX protease family)